MDVDWCLSCDRKLDDSRLTSGPYCSPECLSFAQPTLSSPLSSQPQPAPNAYRIHEWAAGIPPHVPAGAPSRPFAENASPLSPLSPRRSPSPRVRTQTTPKLIERTAATNPVPTLCVSSPAHVRPLPPVRSTHCAYSNANATFNTTASTSEASTSLSSLLSEPFVATPEEGDCSFGFGALVRSLVHRDREHTKSKEDLREIKCRFPPLPSSQKMVSRPKKSTHVRPPSPPRVINQKFVKRAFSPDNALSTSPTSHTPTPVVFPSCRAVEVNWDENEDDRDSFVSQAQFHCYQPKYEPQARAPSSSPSDSSGSCSVLLMAPKRWDGNRGRRGGRAIVP